MYTIRDSRRSYTYRDRNSNGWPDLIEVSVSHRSAQAWGRSVRARENGHASYSFTLLRGGNVEYVRSGHQTTIRDRNADGTPEEDLRSAMALRMIYRPVAPSSGGSGDEEGESEDVVEEAVAVGEQPASSSVPVRPTLMYLNIAARSVKAADRNSDGNPEIRTVNSIQLLYTDRNLDGNPEEIRATFTRLEQYDRNSDGRIDVVRGTRCVFVYVDRDSDGNPEVRRSSCDRWERKARRGRPGGGGTPGNGRPGEGGGRPSRPGGGGGGSGGTGPSTRPGDSGGRDGGGNGR